MQLNYVKIGMLCLMATFSAAFISSFLLLAAYNDAYNVVVTLVRDATISGRHLVQAVTQGVIPVVLCLCIAVFCFMIERRMQPDDSFSTLFFFVGPPCILWGAISLFSTVNAYSKSVDFSSGSYGGSVNTQLQTVFQYYGSVGVLWLIIGVVLIVLARKSEKL